MSETKLPKWVKEAIETQVSKMGGWTPEGFCSAAEFGARLVLERLEATRENDYPVPKREPIELDDCGVETQVSWARNAKISDIEMLNTVRERLRKEVLEAQDG